MHTGNEGQKKIKEIFCRRSEKFYLGLQIDKSSLERVFLKGLEVVNGRNLYDQATKSIANLKKALSFMGKYVDMESGIAKQSGLEIEDVIQKILHDFFKYENNSLSTEDDDSKKIYDIFVLTLAEIDVDSICGIPTRRYWYEYDYVSDIISQSSYFEYLGYEWTPLYTYKCAISAQGKTSPTAYKIFL